MHRAQRRSTPPQLLSPRSYCPLPPLNKIEPQAPSRGCRQFRGPAFPAAELRETWLQQPAEDFANSASHHPSSPSVRAACSSSTTRLSPPTPSAHPAGRSSRQSHYPARQGESLRLLQG